MTASVLGEIERQLVTAGISTAVDSVVLGTDFSDTLVNNLRFAGAAVLGAQLSQEIGIEFAKNEIDPSTGINRGTQLIAHAALGCAAGAVGTGNCGAGSVSQLAGEIAGLVFDANANRDITETVEDFRARGVDIARLTGALASALVGGDVDDINLGANLGGIAAENNALCGGLCVAAAVTALAAAYATAQGEGNIVEGLRIVGRGKDPINQAIATVFDTVTDGIGFVAANTLPDEVVDGGAGFIVLGGRAVGDTLTIIDESTGQFVTTTYDKIPVAAREVIFGVVGTVGFAAGGVGVATKVGAGVTRAANTVRSGGVATKAVLGSKPLITALNPSASEIRAAEHLAAQGRRVELRDPIGTKLEGGTSDLLVDGIPYDVFTPETGNVNRIVSAVAKKNSQAQGIVLDLSSTSVSSSQLDNILNRVRGAGATNINDIIILD